MTTVRHIVTLLKSHIAGDEDRFLSIAMQLAAHEARQGHGKLAQELKDLVDAAKSRDARIAKSSRPVPLFQPKGELAGLLHARYPDLRLSDMILPDSLRSRLHRVLGEQRNKQACASTGLFPVANCFWSARQDQARRRPPRHWPGSFICPFSRSSSMV